MKTCMLSADVRFNICIDLDRYQTKRPFSTASSFETGGQEKNSPIRSTQNTDQLQYLSKDISSKFWQTNLEKAKN